MFDLSKLTYGKALTELEEQVLLYILDNMDDALELGVRKIASANYTSSSTIMRLAKKLGYKGFIDMHYNLKPMVSNLKDNPVTHEGFLESFDSNSLLEFITIDMVRILAKDIRNLGDKAVFIQAAGFPKTAATYMHNKLLVLGVKSSINADAAAICPFKYNPKSFGLFIAISRSGETVGVNEYAQFARDNSIHSIAITGHEDSHLSYLADTTFKIRDSNPLDVNNTQANIFFPSIFLLIELIAYEYNLLT